MKEQDVRELAEFVISCLSIEMATSYCFVCGSPPIPALTMMWRQSGGVQVGIRCKGGLSILLEVWEGKHNTSTYPIPDDLRQEIRKLLPSSIA